MLWLLLICASLAYLAYIYVKIESDKPNLPGPRGLPIVGCLFKLDPKIHLSLCKWSEQFGEIFTFNILQWHLVKISDAKLAREMFALDKLSGRIALDVLLMFEGERFGLINSVGNLWETHRRFTLRHLRDFGFGKNSMESLIMDEVEELVERLKRKNGAVVGGVKQLFSLAVVNSLWTVVSGKRLNQEDPNLRAISDSLDQMLKEPAKTGGIIFVFPWLRYIAPGLTGYTGSRKAFEKLKSFVVDEIENHKKDFQPETCRDFIDVYLKEMQSSDKNSTFYGRDGEKQLAAIIGDLFFAGTDTTSATLAWTILYMATNPEVQMKLQDEIHSITGGTRNVSVGDRPTMPYLQATIEEVLRFSSITPEGVGHDVVSDFEYNGVTFRKGTIVNIAIYHIHHSAKIWGDPENFRPSRFLSDDGKVFRKSENVIPFSVGKRQCLGESLARDSLFLFIANIFQTFCIECDPANPSPSLEAEIGLLLNPQEYTVKLNIRKV